MAYANYSDNIPEVWAAMQVARFLRMGVWTGLARDVSADVQRADTLWRARINDESTIRDWGDNTTITAADDSDLDMVKLEVNQKKMIALYFGVEERRLLAIQTAPETTENAMNKLALGFDSHIRSQFTANVDVLTDGTEAATALATGSTVAQTNRSAGDFGNAAHKDEIYEYLEEMKVTADRRNWPDSGRYCVMSPEYGMFLKQELESRNIHFAGPINDQRALTGNPLSPTSGWEIVIDKGIAATKTAGMNRHPMYWGVRNYGMEFAYEAVKARTIEDRTLPGDEFQAFIRYGAVRNQDNHVIYSPLTIT